MIDSLRNKEVYDTILRHRVRGLFGLFERHG